MNPEAYSKLRVLFQDLQSDSREFQTIWKEDMLFGWRWWLLLALTVLPWVVWALFQKKNSTNRLLYAGFFSIIIAKLLDSVGSSFGLWQYTTRVVPLFPPYFPWDTTLMPVAVMTFLQFKPNISPLIKAVVFAALAAFVMEPLAKWLRLYEPILWRHIYSFAIYLVIYLAADWMSRRDRFDKINS